MTHVGDQLTYHSKLSNLDCLYKSSFFGSKIFSWKPTRTVWTSAYPHHSIHTWESN